MKRIILTGMTKKKFAEAVKSDKPPQCYLCKRYGNEESIYINNKSVGVSKIKIRHLKTRIGNAEFYTPICCECLVLLCGLLDFFIDKKNEMAEVHLN